MHVGIANPHPALRCLSNTHIIPFVCWWDREPLKAHHFSVWRRLRMPRQCRERFPRHPLPKKLLVSDPGMRHGTCVTWCMSVSPTRGGGGGENVPVIPGAYSTRNFTYLARGPWSNEAVFIKWNKSNENCRSDNGWTKNQIETTSMLFGLRYIREFYVYSFSLFSGLNVILDFFLKVIFNYHRWTRRYNTKFHHHILQNIWIHMIPKELGD